jgi:hypothetical protein
MNVVADEKALAQRVLTILAESLSATASGPSEPATDDPHEAASNAAAAEPGLSVSAFCRAEGLCRATYYKLRRLNLAPQVTEVILPAAPGQKRGLKLVRISATSHRQWREKIAQTRASEAAELEAARFRELRVEAGKRAAKSVKHISRRARPKPRRTSR